MEQDTKKGLMLIGSKETFIIKSLEKKLTEAGIYVYFTPTDITEINSAWNSATIIAYYIDKADHFKLDLVHFLRDKLDETNKQIILIGEKSDTDQIVDQLYGHLVLKTFLRPLSPEKLIQTINEKFAAIDEYIANAQKRKSILIVDDDATYIRVIREWLKDKYQVSMVNSGIQAIKWLGMNKADLILLDYEMPVTSGPQVLEMLRSDLETASIPVIFLTGKSDRESVLQVLSLKPEGYLLKTISKEDLLYELQNFFLAH